MNTSLLAAPKDGSSSRNDFPSQVTRSTQRRSTGRPVARSAGYGNTLDARMAELIQEASQARHCAEKHRHFAWLMLCAARAAKALGDLEKYRECAAYAHEAHDKVREYERLARDAAQSARMIMNTGLIVGKHH
jgi:hypothetical protein